MSTSEATPRGAREPMWPKVVIVFGSLTIAWIALLGFGLIKLVEHAI